jgi:hypothetical protein
MSGWILTDPAMQLNEPFRRPALFGPETAAAEDESYGMLSLQFGKLPAFRGMVSKRSPAGVAAVSTSLCSRNEPRNAGLYNGIKPHPRRDSFADLPHGVFREGGDIKVLLDPTGGLRGG